MTIRETIEAYFNALTIGDANQLIDLVSEADHFVKIGTDEGEFLEGGSGIANYYRHHATSTEDFTIKFEHIDVQERGPIGWFYTRHTWCLKWKGKPETLAMRITGVLEREDEGWRFVQIHASVGV
jgi:ketosteroid isomerase-like protein